MATENEWIEWAGGECPVDPEVCVHFRTQFEHQNPGIPIDEDDYREAGSLFWGRRSSEHDIVKYRVVSQ